MIDPDQKSTYRGRIAPTPTGFLHLGHARTFWVAWKRAADRRNAQLVYRIEDLDPQRCKTEFIGAATRDLEWLGLAWAEGPPARDPFGPYQQSERHQTGYYKQAWGRLLAEGKIYPCCRSRKDIARATLAPHEEDELVEPMFPVEWRPALGTGQEATEPGESNWRFRVPVGRRVTVEDINLGFRSFVAGEDFGDFLVWRRDGVPSYELAVVVDDIAMQITEVVRGEDLLLSTARQFLIYEALGAQPPAFFHCPLMRDETGKRLAKRHEALSLKTIRESEATADPYIQQFARDYETWISQKEP